MRSIWGDETQLSRGAEAGVRSLVAVNIVNVVERNHLLAAYCSGPLSFWGLVVEGSLHKFMFCKSHPHP